MPGLTIISLHRLLQCFSTGQIKQSILSSWLQEYESHPADA